MYFRLQRYLCLIVILYILCCLAHDICTYHGLLAASIARLENRVQTKKGLEQELKDLIQWFEKEQLNN